MADDGNNIEVNLKILQKEELDRLTKFSESFKQSVDMLTKNMEDQVSRIARMNQQLAQTPSFMGGTGAATPQAGYMWLPRNVELEKKNEQIQAQVTQGQHRVTQDAERRRMEAAKEWFSSAGSGGGRLSQGFHSWAGKWSMADENITGPEKAGMRMWFGGPPRAQDILMNLSNKFGNAATKRRTMMENGMDWASAMQGQGLDNTDAVEMARQAGHGMTGYAQASNVAGGAAQILHSGGHAMAALSYLTSGVNTIYNSPFLQTGQALGYSRGSALNPLGTGWQEGMANWWEAGKAGWFGLNPTIHGQKQLAQQFANMGFSLRAPENTRLFNNILNISKQQGTSAQDTLQYLEGVKRFGTDDQLQTAMKQIQALGESARQAGMGVEAFRQGVMGGSEALSQQYGMSKVNYMAGLSQFGAQTGLNPQLGAQLAGSQQLVAATMQRTGRGAYDVTKSPTLELSTARDYASSFMGVDISKFGSMSKKEQDAVRNKWAMLELYSPQFKELVGNLSLEQLSTTAAHQTITPGDLKATQHYLSGSGRFGKDGNGHVSMNELQHALSLYYGGDKTAVKNFIGTRKGESAQDMAKDLAEKIGVRYTANGAERLTNDTKKVVISLDHGASKLLKIAGGGKALSIALRNTGTVTGNPAITAASELGNLL